MAHLSPSLVLRVAYSDVKPPKIADKSVRERERWVWVRFYIAVVTRRGALRADFAQEINFRVTFAGGSNGHRQQSIDHSGARLTCDIRMRPKCFFLLSVAACVRAMHAVGDRS